MKKKVKETKIKTIFAILNAEDELKGYFKDMAAVYRELDKEEICEGTILEIVKAYDIYLPEEPEAEISEKKLKEMVK